MTSAVFATSAFFGACGSNTSGRPSGNQGGGAGNEVGNPGSAGDELGSAGSQGTAGSKPQGTAGSQGTAGKGGSGTSAGGSQGSAGNADDPYIEPSKPEEQDPAKDAGPKRPMVCNDAGECSCMNIASIGKLGSYGVGNDNTSVFQAWLNSKSSAHVDVMTDHVPLTRDLLKKYDVVILQGLEEGNAGSPPYWSFSSDEIRAVKDWVTEDGGGLISLIGYGAEGGEVDPVNSLLEFSGISYGKDDVFSAGPALAYCWGGTVPVSDWRSDDSISSAISAHIQEVGVFHGRPVLVGASGASVVAKLKDGTQDLVVAAAKIVGKGRVFVFGDEWVTYSSQWGNWGQQSEPDPYNPCYSEEAGVMRTAEVEFQIAQFWYNVISWDSTAACPLTFKPEVPVIPR